MFKEKGFIKSEYREAFWRGAFSCISDMLSGLSFGLRRSPLEYVDEKRDTSKYSLQGERISHKTDACCGMQRDMKKTTSDFKKVLGDLSKATGACESAISLSTTKAWTGNSQAITPIVKYEEKGIVLNSFQCVQRIRE